MRYVIAALAALTLVLTGCSTSATAAPSQPATATVTATPAATVAASLSTLPACETEETGPEFPPCVWDAKTRGNGKGHSFIWDGSKVTYTD